MRYEAPPYLPLRLVEEQLDTLEGLWARRSALVFSKRLGMAHLRKHDERTRSLLDGLARRRAEASREARLRMASPVPSECLAGTLALLHLEPAQAAGPDGRLALRPRRGEVVVEAFRRAPLAAARALGQREPLGLEARARASELTAADLLPHLSPTAPGVLLALRAVPFCPADDAVLSACLRLAFDEPPGLAPPALVASALYALGLSFARSGEAAAFAALIDVTLGDRVFDTPFAARVMATVGTAVTARRIARRMRQVGASPELVFCLGLLGVPELAPQLAALVQHDDAAVSLEAIRSLHSMSGVWAVRQAPETLREDGKGVKGDQAIANQLASALSTMGSARRHLGRLLEAEPEDGAPASLCWLHAVTLGRSGPTVFEIPEGLLEPRRRSVLLSELAPPREAP